MSVTLLPAAPDPLDPNFDDLAYAYTVAQTAMVPQINQSLTEMNDALNSSLLGVTSTSTSAILINTPGNTVAFTTQANKGYVIGMTLKIASTANPANYVKVRLTAYNISTGVSAGTIISNGGSGTFASWSVFFDVPDPSVLSVPTGEAVAAGNLLAIDDAGNSMSAGAVTTAVLQAVSATTLHACPLSNGNTAIFWTAGTTDLRMMVIDKAGGTVLASTSVATSVNSSFVSSAELTNGNIVLVYFQITTGYPVFKIVNASGVQVVAETVIEAVAVNGQIKCCALTGGGFAVSYNVTSNRYAVYTNAGGVTKAATTNVAGGLTQVAICPTAAGGFIAMAGTSTITGSIYNAAGTVVSAVALSFPSSSSSDVNIASINNSVAGAGSGFAIGIASDSANSPINKPVVASTLSVVFADPISTVTKLSGVHIAALSNGNYVVTFTSSGTPASSEYPRYVIINGIGQIIQSGILFAEVADNARNMPIYVIPKDTNGFSLIWLAATSQNIKFAQVKSGKVVGVSLGAVGSTHQYLAAGEVTVANTNILNVGDSKINYSRRGTKVVI